MFGQCNKVKVEATNFAHAIWMRKKVAKYRQMTPPPLLSLQFRLLLGGKKWTYANECQEKAKKSFKNSNI